MDIKESLKAQIEQAIANKTPLQIVGGGSKAFYTPTADDIPIITTRQHTGIISYDPSELVITARSGTLLSEVESILASQGQCLGFEPPSFAPTATIGGTVACGLAGPRRPFAGSCRDFVLGCTIINGYGEILKFGGQVIKNVAGFDVSRLMAGAMGQLGLILDISLKVFPKPEAELTLTQHYPDADQAIAAMQRLQSEPWPISGLCYSDGIVYIRLSGANQAIQSAAKQLGGDVSEDLQFWYDLKEQRLPFFQQTSDLWRISVPPASPMLEINGDWLIQWGGTLRWLINSHDTPETILQQVKNQEGLVRCFRGNNHHQLRQDKFVLALQQRVKTAFDPHNLFNPHLAAMF